MVGIAGYVGKSPHVIEALSEALLPRGPEVAIWRDGSLALAVRAAMPRVHAGRGIAAVVDGVAEAGTLLDRYAEEGAPALLSSSERYAIALADPTFGIILLARRGDGPPLYYAECRGHMLVGSEPATLLAAGCPAQPHEGAVRRFIETGACDDGASTFFADIKRVLPGQIVEISARGPRILAGPPAVGAYPVTTTPQVLHKAATSYGRLGVRLSQGLPGAALLGAALHHAGEPVPAYTASFPPGGAEDASVDAVLAALPDDSVLHRSVSTGAGEIVGDLTGFLRDVGEPVPDIDAFLLWTTARASTGEVDSLLDASQLTMPYLSRLADACATRFGVTLRLPYRETTATGEVLRRELREFIRRTLPTDAARPADVSRPPAPTADLLSALRSEVFGTFLSESFGTRPWADQRAVLSAFEDFIKGGRQDAEWFWRLYLVERWLRCVAAPVEEDEHRDSGPLDPNPGRRLEIALGDEHWLRFPIRTERVAWGTDLPATVSGHICAFLAGAREDDRYGTLVRRPWYVVVGERAVAAAQGRSYLLWDIRTGWWARQLAGIVGRVTRARQSQANRWTTQLAIAEIGLPRVLLACVAGLIGGAGWFYRVAGPAMRAIDGPTEHGLHPADVSAKLGPQDPDGVAMTISATIGASLPAESARTFGGVVVIDADERGCTVLGQYANRPAEFFAAAFADNPLGDRDEQTPVAVLGQAAVTPRPQVEDIRRPVAAHHG